MITLYEPAFAKLNLTLDILGRRADGYHDLKSVMQTVSLCDDVQIDVGTGKPWVLKCGREDIPCDERNLAWKAAAVFCEALGKDPGGLGIRITKRIPSQAGMGGGSADAAAVLRALNRYYGSPLSEMELAELGAKVGSDVPFCVLGGTCMAEGRGEILRRICAMPDCLIVVCKPEFSVSTPYLFRRIDAVEIPEHPDNDAMESALEEGNLKWMAELIYNVFDPVVSADQPVLEKIKALCRDHGALGCQMTGSGSACFAVMADEKAAENLRDALKTICPDVFICKPV